MRCPACLIDILKVILSAKGSPDLKLACFIAFGHLRASLGCGFNFVLPANELEKLIIIIRLRLDSTRKTDVVAQHYFAVDPQFYWQSYPGSNFGSCYTH